MNHSLVGPGEAVAARPAGSTRIDARVAPKPAIVGDVLQATEPKRPEQTGNAWTSMQQRGLPILDWVTERGPVSPELVLVCPELRQRALADLPAYPPVPVSDHVVPLLRPAAVDARRPLPLPVAALAYAGARLAKDVPLYAASLVGVSVVATILTLVG